MNNNFRSRGSEMKVGMPCSICKNFHANRPCHFKSGACLRCGQTGHFVRECLYPSRTQPSSRILNNLPFKKPSFGVQSRDRNITIGKINAIKEETPNVNLEQKRGGEKKSNTHCYWRLFEVPLFKSYFFKYVGRYWCYTFYHLLLPSS